MVLELRTHFYKIVIYFSREIRKVNHTHCILLFSKRGFCSFRKMKWGETAHRGGFKLEEPPPSLARNSPEPVSAFLEGSLHFTWGGGGVGRCFLGLIRWQHKPVSLGFQSCAWLLGCRMLGEMEGMEYFKTISLLPSPPPTEYEGRVQVQITKSTWCAGDFFRVSHQQPQEAEYEARSSFPAPFLKINTTHFCPSPSHPEPQWRVFVGVLQFPSNWVEDHT